MNWVSRCFCLSFLLIFIHIELDTTGVIEGDNDAAQPMGDPNIEVSLTLNITSAVNRFILSR